MNTFGLGLPWKVIEHKSEFHIYTIGDNPQLKAPAPIVSKWSDGKIYLDKKEAEFIVEACNTYQSMRDKIQAIVSVIPEGEIPSDEFLQIKKQQKAKEKILFALEMYLKETTEYRLKLLRESVVEYKATYGGFDDSCFIDP